MKKKSKKITQTDMILRYLQDVGSITSWQAIMEFGATRLSAVIYNLKADGYIFDEEIITSNNRYGNPVSYKKYIYVGKASV